MLETIGVIVCSIVFIALLKFFEWLWK
jgi:hypothetical protein